MVVRRAETRELSEILAVYAKARSFMKETGNPTQWGEAYPSEALLSEDIREGRLYVLLSDGCICGAFALFEAGDPLYDALDGVWQNALPYAAIHRVASAGTTRGVLAATVAFSLSVSDNLKIDTHEDNRVMQAALAKQGFARCGVADLPEIGRRILYQRYEEKKQ